MIPVYRPALGSLEREYLLEAFDSTWISSKGPFITRFESEFAAYVGAKEGVATCNGTVALHLALAALGVGPGDEVIVPTLTYIATANAVTYTGATCRFVDSAPDTWTIDVEAVKRAVNRRTKAIIPVHLYGHPADMDPLVELAGEHGLSLIEDAAEAHGALYKGSRVGALSTAGCFSFFGNKTITTGEGGMVVTNDSVLAEKLRHYRGQGVSPNRTYWHDVVGFNYRMTNLLAAIGVAQLTRIDSVLSEKRRIGLAYKHNLAGLPELELQPEAHWAESSYWMCCILVPKERRDPLMEYMAQKGIETRPFFHPVHRLPMYRTGERLPTAEDLARRGINLPSYPDLTPQELDYVCDVVRAFFS